MADEDHTETPISSEHDIVATRRVARDMCAELGFGITEVTRVVTAVSELARNVCNYAGEGTMRATPLAKNGRAGVEFVFEDQGPGIENVEEALQAGYTTSRGLGLGLPGARRLMDEFEIESAQGSGTKITIRKWKAR